jgi:hypothetical protein
MSSLPAAAAALHFRRIAAAAAACAAAWNWSLNARHGSQAYAKMIGFFTRPP